MNDRLRKLEAEIVILEKQLQEQDEIMKEYGAYMFGAGMRARTVEIKNKEPLNDNQLSILLGVCHSKWRQGHNLD